MSTESDYKIDDERRRTVDGATLTGEIGIDDEEIAWRKEFTGFENSDAETLEGLSENFERVADDLVDDFYDHLTAHSETVAIMDSSSKPIQALKRDQRQYLIELGRGEYGPDYFARRARIGKIHDMLDLGPKIYLGAYSIYYEGLANAIADEVKSKFAATDGGVEVAGASEPTAGQQPAGAVDQAVDECVEKILSMLKLINLDQQVAMDTYIHSYSKRTENALEQQEQLAEAVQEDVSEPLDNLQQLSEEVIESTDEVADLSDQQESNASQVSDEVADLSASVEEVASTADEVSERGEEATELASNGRESAEEAIDVMEEVTETAEEMGENLQGLEEQIDEIDEFVDAIDNIADQTNILALNASIEAARAGNSGGGEGSGEGFAVVAEEVKELAREASQEADEIEEKVANIQEETTETVETLQTTNEAIEDAVEQAYSVVEDFEAIEQAIQAAANGIQDVSGATDDQAASTEEIASMVDELADQSTALKEEVESIADANREKQEDLNRIVGAAERLNSD